MALNREEKRKMNRSGDLEGEVDGIDDDGAVSTKGRPTPTATSSETKERTSPGQFVKEVRSELRKVAWPTRQETLNYSLIVGVTLVIMTSLIFGLDWVFSEVVLRIFDAR